MTEEEREYEIDEKLFLDEYLFRDAFIDIQVKESISSEDVKDIDPNIGENTGVFNDGFINSYTLKYKDMDLGTLFYDIKSGHYAAHTPLYEWSEPESAIFGPLFSYVGNDIESAFNRVRTPDEVNHRGLIDDIKESVAVWVEETNENVIQKVWENILPLLRKNGEVPFDLLKTSTRKNTLPVELEDKDLSFFDASLFYAGLPVFEKQQDITGDMLKSRAKNIILDSMKKLYSEISQYPTIESLHDLAGLIEEGDGQKVIKLIQNVSVFNETDKRALESLIDIDGENTFNECMNDLFPETSLGWEKKLDLWEEKYKPIDLGGDGGGSLVDYETARKMASKIDPENINNHIWTMMDSDDGEKVIMSAGIRKVNAISYCVSEKSWAEDVKNNELLEVVYFDNSELEDRIPSPFEDDESGEEFEMYITTKTPGN